VNNTHLEEEESFSSFEEEEANLALYQVGKDLGIFDTGCIDKALESGWSSGAVLDLFNEFRRRSPHWDPLVIRNPISVLTKWLYVLGPGETIPWPAGEPPRARVARRKVEGRSESEEANDYVITRVRELQTQGVPCDENRDAMIRGEMKSNGFSDEACAAAGYPAPVAER